MSQLPLPSLPAPSTLLLCDYETTHRCKGPGLTRLLGRRLLSRAHSNYLAQINIRMNERQEQTADVLGKLTVLGTIVLPMNIVTGMWGMNVLVPGQNVENLWWFWCSTFRPLPAPSDPQCGLRSADD